MNGSPPGSYIHGIFSRQEYWSGLPFPTPEGLSNPGMRTETISLPSPTLAGGTLPLVPPGKPVKITILVKM